MQTSLFDNQIKTILKDIKSQDATYLCKKYNIEVNTDGTVYDFSKKVLFNNLNEWYTIKKDRPHITHFNNYE